MYGFVGVECNCMCGGCVFELMEVGDEVVMVMCVVYVCDLGIDLIVND